MSPMRESLAWKIVKYVVKGFFLLLIFGTIALILWRIFSSGTPKSMTALDANDEIVEAWKKAEAEGREMDMFTQLQPTNITTKKENYSYFSVENVVFIRDAEQLQLTFRYNNSTIRHLKEDKGLSELPDRAEDLYDVTLWAVYDLTPDVTGDDENVEYVRYHPTESETRAEQKNVYNYRKYVFDGVSMENADKPLLTVYMDVYYVGDLDYDEEPYGTLPIYQYTYENETYTLTADDRKALEAYGK
jgi:hypothetical protein